MGTEFEIIKSAVTAEEAALYYGLSVNPRTHRAKCPFHGGTHENLSFHAGRFLCFKCGASGTALDFAMQYLGLPTIVDAAHRLSQDFNLGLFDRRPTVIPSWASSQRQKEERLETAFVQWIETRYVDFRVQIFRNAHLLRTQGSAPYMTGQCKRHLHREMRTCGRKYALLRKFLVSGIQRDETYHILVIFDIRTEGNPPNSREMQRLYRLFAVEREQARADIAELESSESPCAGQEIQRQKEVYCLD